MLKQIIYEYILIPYANASGPSNFTDLIARVNEHIINPLLIVLFSVAFVQFSIGLFKFFQTKSGNNGGGDLEQGKSHMLWGIIGMVIMVSVFGIMSLMTKTLGLNDVKVRKGESGDVSSLFQK